MDTQVESNRAGAAKWSGGVLFMSSSVAGGVFEAHEIVVSSSLINEHVCNCIL